MLDFNRNLTTPARQDCGGVVVNGFRYPVDEDEGTVIWAQDVPTCGCGEPLIRENHRIADRAKLVPVQLISYAGGYYVECEACGADYEAVS